MGTATLSDTTQGEVMGRLEGKVAVITGRRQQVLDETVACLSLATAGKSPSTRIGETS